MRLIYCIILYNFKFAYYIIMIIIECLHQYKTSTKRFQKLYHKKRKED
jgi:hypothetical protein